MRTEVAKGTWLPLASVTKPVTGITVLASAQLNKSREVMVPVNEQLSVVAESMYCQTKFDGAPLVALKRMRAKPSAPK